MCSCTTSLSSPLAGSCGISWPPVGPDETTSGTNLTREREGERDDKLSIRLETEEGQRLGNVNTKKMKSEENGALNERMNTNYQSG